MSQLQLILPLIVSVFKRVSVEFPLSLLFLQTMFLMLRWRVDQLNNKAA